MTSKEGLSPMEIVSVVSLDTASAEGTEWRKYTSERILRVRKVLDLF
jgi:hypothetical protein